ncbi:MAG TPA: hypothetical protein VGB45_02900 [Abditibacterium sp.]|jgi:hypothetical protein
MQDFFPRYDWHWDDVSSYFFDGPLLGNGLLGAVLHRRSDSRGGDGRTLLWEFNRSDAIDTGLFQLEGYVWQRFGIGKITMQTRTNLDRVSSHLDVWNAEIRGILHTAEGEFPFRALIDANRPIFWLEVEAPEGACEVGFWPDISGVVSDNGHVDIEESATIDPINPPAHVREENGVFLHTQTLHSEREWTYAQASRRNGNRTLYAATLAYSHPLTGENFDPAALLQEALSQPLEETIQNHRAWWHEFHASGAQVRIDEESIERFYARQSYILGCIARADGPMIDLIGPWYCHTIWRAIWWNLNAQGTYLPFASANRLELMAPLEENLWRERENLRRNAPREWQHDSFALSRASSYDLYAPLDLEDGYPYGGRETGNLLWALHPLWLRYTHTRDEEFGRSRLFPLLEKATNLYFHLLEKGDDGLLHLPTTYSPEYAAAPDCSYDLSLLRWALESLLQLDAELELNAAKAPQWCDTLQNLTPLATDERGVLIGRDVALTDSHRHFSHLLSFWPLKIADLKNADQRALLETSLHHWFSMPEALAGYSFAVATAMWAQLGNGEVAAKNLDTLVNGGVLTKTTLYREAGLCLETPLYGVAAIHEMLLQVQGGVIVPFPAVPESWREVSFENLRVEGAFLVTATRKNGALNEISVQNDAPSEARCLVQLPHGEWQCDAEASFTRGEKWVQAEVPLRHGQRVQFTKMT